jgi:hypothetical protein
MGENGCRGEFLLEFFHGFLLSFFPNPFSLVLEEFVKRRGDFGEVLYEFSIVYG